MFRNYSSALVFGVSGKRKQWTCIAEVPMNVACYLDKGQEFKFVEWRRPPYERFSGAFSVDVRQGSQFKLLIQFDSPSLGLCSDRLHLRCTSEGQIPANYVVQLYGIPRSFDLFASVRNPLKQGTVNGSANMEPIIVDVTNNGRGMAFCHALVFKDESGRNLSNGWFVEPKSVVLQSNKTATFVVKPPVHGDPTSLAPTETLILMAGEEIARQEFRKAMAVAGRPIETSPYIRDRHEAQSFISLFEIMQGSHVSPCYTHLPGTPLRAIHMDLASDILSETLIFLKLKLYEEFITVD